MSIFYDREQERLEREILEDKKNKSSVLNILLSWSKHDSYTKTVTVAILSIPIGVGLYFLFKKSKKGK